MRIVLLAHNLRVSGGLPVGRNIVATLPEIAPGHEYLIVVPEHCGYPDFANLDNVHGMMCLLMSAWKRWRWEQSVFRQALASFKPDGNC